MKLTAPTFQPKHRQNRPSSRKTDGSERMIVKVVKDQMYADILRKLRKTVHPEVCKTKLYCARPTRKNDLFLRMSQDSDRAATDAETTNDCSGACYKCGVTGHACDCQLLSLPGKKCIEWLYHPVGCMSEKFWRQQRKGVKGSTYTENTSQFRQTGER